MKDPIVEEIRRIREEIAAECGYDIDRILEYFKRPRDLTGFKIVSAEDIARKDQDLEE